eukprot:m.351626 g.351626  ORF g.351626 m.351626 type:complete len:1022 (+) comp16297_c0_seq1:95-3160(+)
MADNPFLALAAEDRVVDNPFLLFESPIVENPFGRATTSLQGQAAESGDVDTTDPFVGTTSAATASTGTFNPFNVNDGKESQVGSSAAEGKEQEEMPGKINGEAKQSLASGVAPDASTSVGLDSESQTPQAAQTAQPTVPSALSVPSTQSITAVASTLAEQHYNHLGRANPSNIAPEAIQAAVAAFDTRLRQHTHKLRELSKHGTLDTQQADKSDGSEQGNEDPYGVVVVTDSDSTCPLSASTLVSHWLDTQQQKADSHSEQAAAPAPVHVFVHSAGATSSSFYSLDLLRRVVEFLSDLSDRPSEADIMSNSALCLKAASRITTACQAIDSNSQIILVFGHCDSLQCYNETTHDDFPFSWLPSLLPRNVLCILTSGSPTQLSTSVATRFHIRSPWLHYSVQEVAPCFEGMPSLGTLLSGDLARIAAAEVPDQQQQQHDQVDSSTSTHETTLTRRIMILLMVAFNNALRVTDIQAVLSVPDEEELLKAVQHIAHAVNVSQTATTATTDILRQAQTTEAQTVSTELTTQFSFSSARVRAAVRTQLQVSDEELFSARTELIEHFEKLAQTYPEPTTILQLAGMLLATQQSKKIATLVSTPSQVLPLFVLLHQGNFLLLECARVAASAVSEDGESPVSPPAFLQQLLRQTLKSYGDSKEKLQVVSVAIVLLVEALAGSSLEIQAMPLLQTALSIQDKLFSQQQYKLSWALGVAATVQRKHNRIETAQVLYSRAIDSFDSGAYSDTLMVATLKEGLALTLASEQVDDALELLTECLDTFIMYLGEGHGQVAATNINIARMFLNRDGEEHAVTLLDEALKTLTLIYGTHHIRTVRTMAKRADAYFRQGDWDKAMAHYKHVLRFQLNLFSPGHPDVVVSLKRLAFAAASSGLINEASGYYASATAMIEAGEGRHSLKLCPVLEQQAELAAESGQFEQALALYNRSLSIKEQNYGTDSQELCDTLFNIAHAHASSGKYNLAYEHVCRVGEIAFNVYGAEHELTQTALSRANMLKEAMSEAEEDQPAATSS